MIRHIQELLRHIRIYSELLEPWCIQNPGIIKNLAYSEPDAYSESCQRSTMQRFATII